MLRKILGKTLDYFSGFGDKQDYYNIAREYNWAFEDENIQTIVSSSLKIDKFFKISVRSSVTLAQGINIYYAIVNNNPKSLFVIPILEIPKIFSLLTDYKNKKRILKNKDEAIDYFFHPEQAKEKKGRRNNYSDVGDADWWKN